MKRSHIATAAEGHTGAWLSQARVTDTPYGDMIADMRRCTDLPPLFRSLDHLRFYLRSKGACPEALALAPLVWRKYRRWVDNHPFLQR